MSSKEKISLESVVMYFFTKDRKSKIRIRSTTQKKRGKQLFIAQMPVRIDNPFIYLDRETLDVDILTDCGQQKQMKIDMAVIEKNINTHRLNYILNEKSLSK